MSLLSKIRTTLTTHKADLSGHPHDDFVDRRRRKRLNALAGSRVLIIDDSKTVCSMLGRMLRQNQYDVAVAYNGETGLRMIKEQLPELIFLDIVLPGINGFQVLRALRKSPMTKNIPVIMISGNAQATEKYYAERIGADDFMKKPFTRADVFHRMETFINNHRRLTRMAS
ncbi:response regulator [Kangiella sediminilitoris]|uniref:Response regulator receiver n=1 Tax=Kangiella sediminilitoris TaxID=1144748 RepID=A0A1B3BBP8_9GAMM|nr:response regulator [Kangiella sediminilitoris]AOE50209.1 Response regulator receiver [Kangiella sediminilitoris]